MSCHERTETPAAAFLLRSGSASPGSAQKRRRPLRRSGEQASGARRRGRPCATALLAPSTSGTSSGTRDKPTRPEHRYTRPHLRHTQPTFVSHAPPCEGFINPRSEVRVLPSPLLEGRFRTGSDRTNADGTPNGTLEQVNPKRSVLSAMLFVVVAPPDRWHIADIPRFGDVATAEMIVLRTLRFWLTCSKPDQRAAPGP